MPKLPATLALSLPPRDAGTPAYRWLCDSICHAILEGRLRAGTRLPATRDLAQQYGLARGTVLTAFAQLRSEGYLRARVGSGTYVNDVLPEAVLHHPRGSRTAIPSRRPAVPQRRLSEFGRRAAALPPFPDEPVRAFRANQPALDLFPSKLWAQLAGRRMRRATASLLLDCDAMGWRPLREAVAGYLSSARGVSCDPAQVAIVSGVQEALDLSARLFVEPGDIVCLEDPGYHGAAQVFDACRARICPVPVDDEGMTLPRATQPVRLAYVTPAHQFPLGVSMSLPRRLALLEWARASGALLFEDDYDSEYRFAGRPMRALQGLDRHGVVLFAGSFSKVLYPSLRLGYLVVPPDLADRVAAAKSVTSRHAAVVEQAVLCDFMTEGHFGRHVRRMREIYAERLGALQEGMRAELGGLAELAGIEAGLQATAWLSSGIGGEDAARAAAGRGVEVTALSRYARLPLARDGLQLGFAAIAPAEIRRGVCQLAAALASLQPGRRAAGRSDVHHHADIGIELAGRVAPRQPGNAEKKKNR